MASRVILLPLAENDLKELSQSIRARVAAALYDLENFPEHRTGIKKLKPPFDGFRKRLGNYRILFDYSDSIVFVHRIIHRKDAYR